MTKKPQFKILSRLIKAWVSKILLMNNEKYILLYCKNRTADWSCILVTGGCSGKSCALERENNCQRVRKQRRIHSTSAILFCCEIRNDLIISPCASLSIGERSVIVWARWDFLRVWAFSLVLQNDVKSPADAPDPQTMPQFISNSLTEVGATGSAKGRMCCTVSIPLYYSLQL